MKSHPHIPGLLLAAACLSLTATGAVAAPAPAALKACTKISGDAARLACYDAAMGLTKQAPAAPQNAPRAGADAADATHAKPALPSAQVTPAQFGSEQLDSKTTQSPSAPKALDRITATVKSHRFNPWKKFTVTLANGQIWQQEDGDTSRPARFPDKKDLTVTISRGMFGSYNLQIEGSDLVYKVRRVR